MDEKIRRGGLNRWVMVRLKEGEFRAWANLVGRLGTTKSKLMRQLMREAVGLGPEALTADFRALDEVGRQISALGRNLNQIARHLNAGRIANADHIREPLAAAQASVDRVSAKIDQVIYRTRQRWVHHGRP